MRKNTLPNEAITPQDGRADRTSAEEALKLLFLPQERTSSETLQLAENILFNYGNNLRSFRLPISFTITSGDTVITECSNEFMLHAIQSIVEALRQLPPDKPVIMDIDGRAIRNSRLGR